ncbi:MAG: hypothetical protein HY319_31175 [Armatimonadetes bacterium]|nr:hypothetical protein [Armatimonadota bacterium]
MQKGTAALDGIGSADPLEANQDGFQARRSRLLEMAQGAMAEKLGQTQAVVPAQPVVQTRDGGGPRDVAALSEEAVEELQTRRGNGAAGGADSLISALRQIVNEKLGEDRPSEVQRAGAPGGAGQSTKEEETTRTREWEPTLEQGTIHVPGDQIGKIRDTVETGRSSEQQPGDPQKGTRQPNQAGGTSGGGAGGSGAGGAGGQGGVAPTRDAGVGGGGAPQGPRVITPVLPYSAGQATRPKPPTRWPLTS